MFNPHHAWTALETADRLLVGPLGMKTLVQCDWAYDGHYNVDDDGSDPKKAHGFSYHNGPVRDGQCAPPLHPTLETAERPLGWLCAVSRPLNWCRLQLSLLPAGNEQTGL